ncbi:hypothetical protein LWP59_05645 [Amycolatopsis acidiphila]|uniref:Uncharacterized protein n=1 Tax=Amycolatopsis acidiphila TaxID=715473 RepID=A0A558AHY8_9PSEU|nr:hypothetical protein [Amycolatopsis acidiphila]TVT23893.1 hypothetical protein FNH06_08510 [Amycolatopsis acidiphila]UIJ61129.1 hypothetical protein LWP59_05645 [Amycolatopsis acidiphila]GHG86544.1 hypothetical protein GCM10017788_59760 [Amycolatopsis acidiphila]
MNSAPNGPPNERSHPPSDDRAWRESFYFGFVDSRCGLGVYNSLGEKPVSGRSAYICTLWREDLLAETYIAGLERTATEHACGGLRYRLNEDDRSWAIEYQAKVPVLGPVGRSYVGQIDVDEALPRLDVAMDLRFEPTTPAYEYASSPAWSRLFDGHVEQSGRFTGVVTIADARYEIDAFGSRDHSWGPRDWSHPRGWTFFTASFDRGPAFISLWAAETASGSSVDGYVWRDGAAAKVTAIACDVAGGRPAPGVPFTVRITDSSGATTDLVCRAHSVMRHQVGGGRGQLPSHVDRWLVEINSPRDGIGHGEFELLSPIGTEPAAPRQLTSTPD